MGLLKTREDDASYNWQEWELQVVVVRDMRRLEDVDGRFTVAGDMNGVHLTNQQASKAKLTGMRAGEPDLRFYCAGGRLLLVELKRKRGVVSDEQKERHARLRALGYQVEVVKAATPAEASALVRKVVLEFLAQSS